MPLFSLRGHLSPGVSHLLFLFIHLFVRWSVAKVRYIIVFTKTHLASEDVRINIIYAK